MKIRVPGQIFATPLMLVSLVPKGDLPRSATTPETPLFDRRQVDSSANLYGLGVAPSAEEDEELISAQKTIPPERRWDKSAQKRFNELAANEALETITRSELLELEQLSILRRHKTARNATAEELMAELKQWRAMNRVISALDDYVEEIGVDVRFKSNPQK